MTACLNGVQLMPRCSLSAAKITEKIDIPILFGIFFMYKQEIVETHPSCIPTISNRKEWIPFYPFTFLRFYLFTILLFYLFTFKKGLSQI